jgi:hypothetical protein
MEQWALAHSKGSSNPARILTRLILNPLHSAHAVVSIDIAHTLGELKAAYRPIGTSARKPHSTPTHTSGKHAAEFEALRHAAPRLAKDATSAAHLTKRLLDWADPAKRPEFQQLSRSDAEGLCARVAEYTFKRRHGGVASSTINRVQAAAETVAREHRINSSSALAHLPGLVADVAQVDVRTIRRIKSRDSK